MRKQIKTEYELQIKFKVLEVYNKVLAKLQTRHDKDEILAVMGTKSQLSVMCHTHKEKLPD